MKQSRYEKFKKEIEYILRKSPKTIHEIYKLIKEKFPSDCDDSEPCIHKGHFYQYGEWKHQVRNALQGLQKNKSVEYSKPNKAWQHKQSTHSD